MGDVNHITVRPRETPAFVLPQTADIHGSYNIKKYDFADFSDYRCCGMDGTIKILGKTDTSVVLTTRAKPKIAIKILHKYNDTAEYQSGVVVRRDKHIESLRSEVETLWRAQGHPNVLKLYSV